MGVIKSLKADIRLRQVKRRIRSIPDPVLSNICNDVQARLGTDAAFCTFVNSQRAYVVGASETMPSEFTQSDGISLNASFCATLINSVYAESGIVSENTRVEPMLKYCPTTALFGSWVGAPIHFRSEIVGAIGVADSRPHEWPADALPIVRAAARLIEAEISKSS